MPERRAPIYERAVEEVIAGCGHEGYHSFGFTGDTTPRPAFDVAAKLAEMNAETAKMVITSEVQ